MIPSSFHRACAFLLASSALTLSIACGGTLADPGDTNGGLTGQPAKDDAGAGDTGSQGAAPARPLDAPVCASEPILDPNRDAGPADCRCTRRPGPGNSWRCPMGADESVSATIGAQGGQLSLTGQQGKGVQMVLDIPPGALAVPTLITLTETSHAPPAAYIDWSPVWKIEPVDIVFAKPVSIKMPNGSDDGYASDTGARAGWDQLKAQWSADGCAWAPLADSYMNAGFHNGSTKRGGYAFSGYPKTEANALCP